MLCRHTPKVGAVCPNWARTDLCGGRSVMSVPTAISEMSSQIILLKGRADLRESSATMMGPVVGGLFSSTQLMVITTMAAASLSANQALGVLQGGERADALFLIVMLAGIFQILFGLVGLGRL